MRKRREQSVSAVLGFVVGDALGVPVEFRARGELAEDPVEDMREYGTHHQPAGTWSDDTSMVVATMEWLTETEEEPADYGSLIDKFASWLLFGDYTPYGRVFDCGISTSRAIWKYFDGEKPLRCGGGSVSDNGNGSLMRILPAAIRYCDDLAVLTPETAGRIYELSSLTHAHARSRAACLIYSAVAADLMRSPEKEKEEIVERSLFRCRAFLEAETDDDLAAEAKTFQRLWEGAAFRNLREDEIRSTGYVLDTLEAAVWCFLTTDSYAECVRKAVNLGDDTDTVGAVAGGLAGLYYGRESIPEPWLAVIPKRDWIEVLAAGLVGESRN